MQVSLSVAHCLPFVFVDNRLSGRLVGIVAEVLEIDKESDKGKFKD